MSDIEQRLHDALNSSAETVRPTGDLVPRLQEVVAAARRNRRRRKVLLIGIAAVTVAALVAALVTGALNLREIRPFEGGTMSWWVLELATNVVLITLLLWLGPFIKHFGRAYAADVFHDNPLTGKSYLVLADIVYYLIFTSYILFTVQLQAPGLGATTAGQLESVFVRIGGILLIMGVLHGLNLVMMPVLGRVFSLNRRLVAPTTLAPSQREVIGRDGSSD